MLMMKLNSDKAEVMLFTSKHNAINMKNVTVCFGDINITSVNTVRNLGVIFDSALNMEQQLNNICRSGYHQLHNIGHIRLSSMDGLRPSLTSYNVYRTHGTDCNPNITPESHDTNIEGSALVTC